MEWLIHVCRTYPSIPIFFTIGIGFLIGKLKYKNFSLGSITSVLLVGIIVGQMDIKIGAPLQSLFFLIFLFAIGYKCGPQFVAALKGEGLKQVLFAVIVCFICFLVTIFTAWVLDYNAAIATGLFAGAQTVSAVIGIGADTISSLDMAADVKQSWIDLLPVCYAVTYVYGTLGSVWILGNFGPWYLGGLNKVKKETRELEEQLSHSATSNDPALINAGRSITFRAYKVTSDHFSTPRSIADIEAHFHKLGRRIFVERVRDDKGIISDPNPSLLVKAGDEIVLSGRHEYIIQDESWIGPEIDDPALMAFSVANTRVLVTRKASGMTIGELRSKPWMYGVLIASLARDEGIAVPILDGTKLLAGDMLGLQGLPQEVKTAVPNIGYEERPTSQTDMIFFGLALALGALVGTITLQWGKVPVSLSTSGGALLSGLFFGWLRVYRPSVGMIPEASLWLMNNLGLTMFIAVIGIKSGPTFIGGLREVGFTLLLAGVFTTSVPLFAALWLGKKVFKFHPAITLGCCAGSRKNTASLGAVTSALESSVPALGYTVTYAVSNTLLILMGVAMVLLLI